jgi:hypothetical protein
MNLHPLWVTKKLLFGFSLGLLVVNLLFGRR